MPLQIPDLLNSYQAKTDEELVRLATNSEQLTVEAQSVLRSELARRRIDAAEYTEAQDEKEHLGNNARSAGSSLPEQPRAVGEFVQEVFRIYRGHFWFFMKLVCPAVVVGYIAVLMGRNEAWEIARHLPRDGRALLSHQTDFAEIWLSNTLGYLVSWMAFSFSFGAICFVVSQIDAISPEFARGSLSQTGLISTTVAFAVFSNHRGRRCGSTAVRRHFLDTATGPGSSGTLCNLGPYVWGGVFSAPSDGTVWTRYARAYLG